MAKMKLTCPATTHSVFAELEFKDATEGLADGPEGGRPFMISYDLFISGETVFCQPDARVWLEIDGRMGVLALGALNIEMSREMAPQVFELLSWDRLRSACEDTLLQMIDDAQGETFHVCLSRYGAIIAASDMHSIAYHYGEASAISALIPESTSHHQALEGIAGLQRCANALMSLENASNSFKRSSEIRVQQV